MKTLFKVLLLLTLPAAVQAQFTFTTNNGAITITGYTGPGGVVVIPSKTNGLPVTNIGDSGIYGAFQGCTALTSVTIPGSVTNIGSGAFSGCTSLTNATIGDGVISIADSAFYSCFVLTNVTIPDSVVTIGSVVFSFCQSLATVTIGNHVTRIGSGAFGGCPLTSLTIPNSATNIGSGAFQNCNFLTSVIIGNRVTSIEDWAFAYCTSLASITIPNSVTNIGLCAFVTSGLTGVYFKGNAPSLGSDVFKYDNATVYYLPGTTNWGAWFGNLRTVLWNPQVQTSGGSFGVRTNRFGFTITGSSNLVIVVEACTNLAKSIWAPVGTNTLTSDSSYFNDSRWTNYTRRFYRLRSP